MGPIPGSLKDAGAWTISLRSLVLAMLALGLFWALTETWGIADLKQLIFAEYRLLFPGHFLEYSGKRVVIEYQLEGSEQRNHIEYEFSTVCPCYVICEVTLGRSPGRSREELRTEEFLWILGWPEHLNPDSLRKK